MSETPRLHLPYIAQSQAQKEVTHSMGLDILDTVVQATVLDRDLSTPPALPVTGATYIVGPAPTDAWADHAGHIAAYISAQWKFATPLEGWLCYVQDEDLYVSYNGTAWQVFSAGGGGSTFLGLSDTPDSYTGQASKVVSVNAGATALEFTTPSAGASTFLALTDTPDAYTGTAGQYVKVNAGASALEFGAGTSGTFLALTDTPDAYTGQNGKVVSVTSDATGLEFIPQAAGSLGLHRGALVQLAANQSVPHNTATTIAWGTVVYDSNSVWSASQPTRLTVPAGVDKMLVQAQLELTTTGTGMVQLSLLHNGTTVAGQGMLRQPVDSATLPAPSVVLSVNTPPLVVSGGDYFELAVLQDSGGPGSAVAGQTSWIAGVIISSLAGGGAAPGGSSGQGQYNNGGTFGGSSALTMDSTTLLSLAPLTTKGDVLVQGTTAPARLAVGSNGQVLMADSGETLGVKWAAAAGGGSAAAGAVVQRISTQGIVQNTNTAVIFDTETRDDAGFWTAGSPTRLTIPTTGWYSISAFVQWDATTGVTRIVNVRVNGTQYIAVESTGNAGVDQRQTIAIDWYLTAADYVEIVLFQSTAGTRQITANASIVGLTAAPDPATTFLSLSDTPDTYSGQAGKVVQVNAGATALEFAAALSGTPLRVPRYTASGTALEPTPLTIDATTGNLGLRTATPAVGLHLVSEVALQSDIQLDHSRNTSSGTQVVGRRARGTLATPARLQLNDILVGLRAFGWVRNAADTADDFVQLGDLRYAVDEIDAQGRGGGNLRLFLSAGGSAAAAQVLYCTQAGNLLLGSTGGLGTGATRTLGLGPGVAPSTSPTDVVQLTAVDRGGTAGKRSLQVRTEDSTSHLLGDLSGIGTLCDATLGAGASYQALNVKGSLLYVGQSSVQERPMALVQSTYVVNTDATRTTRLTVSAYDAVGAREGLRIEADGANPRLGFLGAAAVVRQTVPAAASDPATTMALANSLRAALVLFGLCA